MSEDFTKGGRGKRAPYETTHLRVPVPIKDEVQELIDEYKKNMKQRDELGKFALKSGTYRKTHAIRATDETWQAFRKCADAAGCSTADLLEQWVAASSSQG